MLTHQSAKARSAPHDFCDSEQEAWRRVAIVSRPNGVAKFFLTDGGQWQQMGTDDLLFAICHVAQRPISWAKQRIVQPKTTAPLRELPHERTHHD